jgi:hypothetical protein
MDFERKTRLTGIWHKVRWLLFTVAAAVVVFGTIYLLSPATRSRWTLSRNGSWLVFTERIMPRPARAAFQADYPASALAWYSTLGLDLPPVRDLPLVTFAAWGGYQSMGMDDPLVFRSLKGRKSADLRLISMMSTEFRLNEPVASCFVTGDGKYLFMDLQGDPDAAEIHGLAHVLARTHVPQGLAAAIDPSRADSFDPRVLRAFRFTEETAALFLSDLFLSGARGLSKADLEAYAAYVDRRYAPDGPIFKDDSLTFAFSSDPRTARSFAASARFALAMARDKGFPALASWSARVLRGDYPSLDGLCAPLGGGLQDLLSRYLGEANIPE